MEMYDNKLSAFQPAVATDCTDRINRNNTDTSQERAKQVEHCSRIESRLDMLIKDLETKPANLYK